ncbi:MAG: hypothetical protein ACXVZV_00985 [Terriglobales bacterium]
MSLTSVAMIGLFAIVVLLIARAKVREKDAEVAAMATMMGMQKVSAEGAQLAAPRITSNGESEVREWSFGDKPEDMLKPGVHFSTHVKVKLLRKKL